MLRTETTLNASETGELLAGMQNPPALAAKMAAGIVHDLGNLIQIASSAVNIVARRLPSHTSELDVALAGARTSLEQAGTLVRRTMSLARDRSEDFGQISVLTSISEVEILVQAAWDHVFQLDVKAGPDLPFVKCDPLALQNALFNLLLNARDAMPDGGTISIHANRISLGPGAPAVEIRVVDTGIGMKPDTVDRAFDPFFTTKSDGLGGVGLPMVERFAHAAGGRVFIESEYGVGTAATLQLPAVPTSTDLQPIPRP